MFKMLFELFAMLQLNYGIVLFFLFPIIGLLMDLYLSAKALKIILIVTIALFAPLVFGYDYIYSFINGILIIMVVATVYAFICRKSTNKSAKVLWSVVFSAVLFFILGFIAFILAIAGYQKVEQRWETGAYRVDYIRDQGFAGGPLMKYTIYQYGVIPIYIKELETHRRDTAETCTIYFYHHGILFDKCKGTAKAFD